MPLGIDPVRFGVLLAITVAFGYIWLLAGRGAWYRVLSERFLYGVPWGTVVSIVGVVGFYLVAQSGFSHWGSPVTLPFRSWSYFYPEAMLVSGFAHASPGHLTGNMIGTLVLAPIVEYGWSHYPPREPEQSYKFPPPGSVHPGDSPVKEANGRLVDTPWVRALVIFPAIVFAISLLTSVLALGWSLGFSGTVFAFGGFAVVYFPLAAVVAMVAFTSTSILFNTLQQPVLRATADTGAPGPPSWWAVNVQAHMLGFLIGVVLAIALLQYRAERRRPEWVFFAALIFTLTRQLFAFTTSGGEDIYLQLRGIGLIFILALIVLITATVAADDHPLPNPFTTPDWLPTNRLLSVLWVGSVVGLGWLLWATIVGGGNFTPLALAFGPLLFVLFVLPAFRKASRVPRRNLLMVALVAVIVVVAIPSIAGNSIGMSDDPVPPGETVAIEDYEITYAEDVEHGRVSTTDSGVVVVSEKRQIWSTVLDTDELEHDGEGTVTVGGFGWREVVTATRTGWDVTGGGAAYVVDLEHDGERTRAFHSKQAEARAQVSGMSIAVKPVADEFLLNVTRDGDQVDSVEIPPAGENATVAELEFSTEEVDGTRSVFAESDGTRVLIAQREEYD